MTAADDMANEVGDLEITGSTGIQHKPATLESRRGREPMSQASSTQLIEAYLPLASITQADRAPREQMHVVLDSAATVKCDLSQASDE